MNLTAVQIDFLARRASWYVECRLKPNRGRYTNETSYVTPGQGVPDLDSLDRLMGKWPFGQFSIDVGALDSSYRAIDREDVAALRAAYIRIWGNVPKPPIVERP